MSFEDKENKVERGQRLRIKASTFNDMQDVVRAYKRDKAKVGLGKPTLSVSPNTTVWIKNESNVDWAEPFKIIKIYGTLFDVGEDILNVGDQPVFIGHIPTASTNAIVVIQEPIEIGQIGKAVIMGVTVAKVYFTGENHEWANPSDDNDSLDSSENGQVRILMDLGESGLGGEGSIGDFDSGEIESGSGAIQGDTRWCLVNLIGSKIESSGTNSVELFASKITEISGEYDWQERKLDSTGVAWENGSLSGNDNAYPMEIEGVVYGGKLNANAIMWKSKQTGKYEFFPVQFFDSNHVGLVSRSAQSKSGNLTLTPGIDGTPGNFVAEAITANDGLIVNLSRSVVSGSALRVYSNDSGDDYALDVLVNDKIVNIGSYATDDEWHFKVAGDISMMNLLTMKSDVNAPVAEIEAGVISLRSTISIGPNGAFNIRFMKHDGGTDPAELRFPTGGYVRLVFPDGSSAGLGQTLTVPVKDHSGANKNMYFQNGWLISYGA